MGAKDETGTGEKVEQRHLDALQTEDHANKFDVISTE